MLGIIGAMDSEVNELKECMKNPQIENISGIDFYLGEIENKKIVLAKSGVGKVFAAVCAEIMILKYKPDSIINIGIAGSLIDNLKIGDVAIAESVVQYDIDTTEVGDLPGLISGINIVNINCDKDIEKILEQCAKKLNLNYETGVIATGDRFVKKNVDKEMIKKEFKGICSEMEGGSIGQVCYINGVKFCVVRVISDLADENANVDYTESKNKASSISIGLIKEYIAM